MLGRRLLLAALAASIAVVALVTFLRRPEHAFLVADGGGEWIRSALPFDLVARSPALETRPFRHRFTLAAGADGALHVQALRAFRLRVNGRIAGEAGPGEATWRHAKRFDLSPYLVPGENELLVDVQSDLGHPLLLAWSEELGVATGAGWEAPGPDGSWQPALTADEARSHAISAEFPSAWAGLRATWTLWLVSFALGSVGYLAQRRWLASSPWRLRAGHARALALAALAALGLHNLRLVDTVGGFDTDFHFEYIRYVVSELRVPLANEGWQMFQAPLFYLLAAPPYWLVAKLFSEPAAALAMRLLVLLCALGLVEMVYRAARLVFPAREDLQIFAVATGGFLPMTVYMSHWVTNETFAALLTAALVVAALHLLTMQSPRLDRWGAGVGALFGLALLAKVTVALLLPLLVAVLVRAAQRQGRPLASALGPLARFAAASTVVAGWYFARNWLEMGTPYVGGWDPSRGGAWIQDPGYRTPADLLSFGAVLDRPIYAVFSGLWDALYASFWLDGSLSSSAWAIAAPPWHYRYVVACALLALPLSVAGIAGALRALRPPRDATQESLLFAVAAVALYLAAIFVMYIRLPVFSTVKSTYAMGLAPCYGVLFAWGFDLLPRHRAVRAALTGYLCAWLAFVFRAYFS